MLWSASARFPHEVRSEIPSASFKRSVFTSCACGLGHPAHVTDRTAWEMREHMMISLWFGTAGSLDQKTLSLPHRVQPKEVLLQQEGLLLLLSAKG